MTPEAWDAFVQVHADLPRQGPGLPADVAWAIGSIGLRGAADILDAGCGTGEDSFTLAQALPQATITALEQVPQFVEAAAARTAAFEGRVSVRAGDMAKPGGPYDLIWCGGAIYFLGVTEGLTGWRGALKPGGRVAFSEPVLLQSPPSPGAAAFWEDYPAITDLDGIEARVSAAGYNVLSHRLIVGAPWAAYYDPMQARLDALRAQNPGAAMRTAIDDAQAEIDRWRAAQADVAYALLIVAPA